MWEEDLTVPFVSAQLSGVGITNRKLPSVVSVHCLREASWSPTPMWGELEGWRNVILDKDTFRFLLRFT